MFSFFGEPLPAGPWPLPGLPVDAFAALAIISSLLVLAVVIVGLLDERHAAQALRATPRPAARRTIVRSAA